MSSNLKLVSSKDKADKPRRSISSPKVNPYCPECKGSTWIYANQGRAEYSEKLAVRVRMCVHCLSKGKVVTW